MLAVTITSSNATKAIRNFLLRVTIADQKSTNLQTKPK